MKKRFRSFMSVLLTVVIIIGVIVIAPIATSAAEEEGEIISASCVKTQTEAVAWLNAQEGARYDLDGAYGSQCSDFSSAYVNYVLTGNPYGGRIGVYNAKEYSNASLYPNDWQIFANTATFVPQPGDIFVVTGADSRYGHTGVVISSNVNNATVADQNGLSDWSLDYGSPAHIHNITWSGSFTPKYFIRPSFAPAGNNPQGVLDGVSGGEGTVSLNGWAFDRDNLNASLEIHVYIGGRSGDSNAEGHGGIIANLSRPDVNNVHGCGNNHGFGATISTNKRGSQPVYVYALNVGSGDNVQIGEGTVNITSSGQPQITALYLSEKKKDSYRVCVQIDRPVDVWEVRVATWTDGNQSDLKWTYASYNGYGTYFVDISRSEFLNYQRYINHVYVYDYSGNSYSTAIDMNYKPPVISDVVISQVSTRGMRVTCKVEGETNITSVKFPTWPAIDGNPIWHGADDIGNGYFTAYIRASEHNNPQSMAFHIYAYDAYGSESSWGTGRTQLNDEPMEFASRTYKNNKYVFYNTALTWEDANKWCEDNGGHLVTIKDQDEWNAVSDLLKQANGARCWFGANSKNGDWKWVTGEEVDYNQWAEGEPNCSGGLEYYLGTISTGNDVANCYLWNDYGADRQAGFICEFENVIGDLNDDRNVDVLDATIVQKHASGKADLTPEQIAVADVNNDGVVDILDSAEIQKFAAGKITKFTKKA